MASEVGIGLIGAGAIGRVHANNVHRSIKGARLAAVADVDQKAAQSVAGDAKIYSDFHEMIRDSSVEAVLACTPPFLKMEITKAAVEAGKSVFCEKPISVTLDEANEMTRMVKKGGIRFQVGYQRRFDPSYLKARSAMESGELGQLLLLKEHNRDPPSPIVGWSTMITKSGGIYLDTTSHDFDAVRWLSGSEVERIYAEGAALIYDDLRKNGDFDTTTVVMKLESGTLAYVDSCYTTVYGFDARLEMLGTKAAAFVDIGERSFAHIRTHDGTSNEYFDGFASRWAQAYRDEVADFVDCIRTGRDVKVGIADGREALKIGLAARASTAEGRPIPVKRD